MKFVSIFKSKAFKIALMVGLFTTSLLIILAMLLGNESGNFVVQVESGDAEKSIAITDNEEDTIFTNKLVAPGMTGMACTTPRMFLGDTEQDSKINDLTSKLGGQITADTVYIYTFEVVNTGSGALNMEFTMSLSNITNRTDDAIRIMTYNPSDTNETIHVYQKRDTDNQVYQYYPRTPEFFSSGTQAFSQKAYMSASSGNNFERLRYAIFVWIEGYDPEATEEIIANGKIKFALNIKVIN